MKIEQANLVISYAPDHGIAYTLSDEIKAVSKRMSGKVLPMANVPSSAPLEFPRVIIQNEKIALSICANRLQLIIGIPEHVQNSSAIGDFISDAANLVLTPFMNTDLKFDWIGLVSNLEYIKPYSPGDSAIKSVDGIVRKIINVNLPGKLANFNLQLGSQIDEYFISYTISGVESRRLLVQHAQAMHSISIQPDDGEILDTGVRVVLDINSKPKGNFGNILEEVTGIIRIFSGKITSVDSTLNIQGLLP